MKEAALHKLQERLGKVPQCDHQTSEVTLLETVDGNGKIASI